MKIPDKCFRGHSLSGDNLAIYNDYKTTGGKRWHCKACQRLRQRKRQKTPLHRQRGPYERVRPEPFLKWFDSYCRRYDFTTIEAAKNLGIDEKTIRRMRKPNIQRGENGMAPVALVDKALLFMDTNIKDLYPELYPDE